MDRGFCKLERIKDLIQDKERYFVMRIKNDMSLQMLKNGKFLVGTGTKKVGKDSGQKCERGENLIE